MSDRRILSLPTALPSDEKPVPEVTDWNMRKLNNLADVEALLDQLEIHNTTEKKLDIIGNGEFVVRWR